MGQYTSSCKMKAQNKQTYIKGLHALVRAVQGSGRVGFRPNPDSTRRHRVEGRSNPKPTAGKIGRFGFLWWLASVGSDRLSELKKGIEIWRKSVAGIWNFGQKLEILAGNWKISAETGKFSPKTGFFLKYAFFFFARNCWVWPDLAKSH